MDSLKIKVPKPVDSDAPPAPRACDMRRRFSPSWMDYVPLHLGNIAVAICTGDGDVMGPHLIEEMMMFIHQRMRSDGKVDLEDVLQVYMQMIVTSTSSVSARAREDLNIQDNMIHDVYVAIERIRSGELLELRNEYLSFVDRQITFAKAVVANQSHQLLDHVAADIERIRSEC